MKNKKTSPLTAVLTGGLLLTAGVGLIYIPAGLICGGLLLMAAGVLSIRGGGR